MSYIDFSDALNNYSEGFYHLTSISFDTIMKYIIPHKYNYSENGSYYAKSINYNKLLLDYNYDSEERSPKRRHVDIYDEYIIHLKNGVLHHESEPAFQKWVLYENRKICTIEVWAQDGKPLRMNDKPTSIMRGRNGHMISMMYRNQDGYLHRDNGPAIFKFPRNIHTGHMYEYSSSRKMNGNQTSAFNIKHLGLLDSIFGNTKPNLYKVGWMQNGVLHRRDGPAIELSAYGNGPFYNGRNTIYRIQDIWINNGKVHRDSGPAITQYYYGKTTNQWWIDGTRYTKKQMSEIVGTNIHNVTDDVLVHVRMMT